MASDELRGGRFVLLAPLGEGAQGRTFDGVDKREGKPVAIKRFDVRGAKSWKDVELAEREARVLQSLAHPKLPAYVDHFEEGGALYLVMEKIEGESLASIKKRGGSLSEDDVLRLLRDAGEVLAYLHGRAPPVIHRDLKPGNVIRRKDGSFAFVDFGAVRDKLRPEGGSTVVGTFGFMAPEQFQGRALPQSDVYAIGATALAMLTGREPEDLPHRGLAIDVRAALGGKGSPRMIELLERMLDPNPDARASRIAPLLERAATSERPRRRERDRDRERARDRDRDRPWDPDRFAAGLAQKIERRVQKQARRAAKRAERAARRHGRRAGGYVPGPFVVFVRLALVLAVIATTLTTQVIVPTFLRLLSLVFGRALRDAANDVRAAGDEAVSTIRQIRVEAIGEDARVRVDAPPPEVRVADDAPGEPIEEEDEEPRAKEKRGA